MQAAPTPSRRIRTETFGPDNLTALNSVRAAPETNTVLPPYTVPHSDRPRLDRTKLYSHTPPELSIRIPRGYIPEPERRVEVQSTETMLGAGTTTRGRSTKTTTSTRTYNKSSAKNGSAWPQSDCSTGVLFAVETIACLAYCSLFLIAFVDWVAMLNNGVQNNITASITASTLMYYVTAILIYCIPVWTIVFVVEYGCRTSGELTPRHYRPMFTHLLCFGTFIVILEIFVILFYYQVQGTQSNFQDRYVGDLLTPLLDVRIYIQWQLIKLFIVAYAPLEANLFSYCWVRHRNPNEHLFLLPTTKSATHAAV